MRSAPPRWAALAGAAAVAALAVLAVAASDGPSAPSALPFDGRSPLVPEGRTMRVLVELQRPSLGDRMARERIGAAAQRAYVRSLRREADALESALAAKAVRLDAVVPYERVWNGFAATIRTADLPRVQTLGVRVQAVRRFYPATQEVGPKVSALGVPTPESERRVVDVALLDSGVDLRHPALRGRIVPGHDAVDGDEDPSGAGRDWHGTQVAGVLAAELGEDAGILAIRVAGLQRTPETGELQELGTTDQLLTGLEHAVDPDGDGDVEDRARVALVGVSSPYTGFAGAPEAEAAGAAAGLGTLVVAPAGNEGSRSGRFGTIGSPGAARQALAVGALEGGDDAAALPAVRLGLASKHGRATLDGHLLGGAGEPLRRPATGLVGPSQANPSARGRAAGGAVLEYFDVDARPRARERLVVVPARSAPLPATVVAAARGGGAAGIVLCDPGGARLRAVPRAVAGRLPVIGLAGDAARRALELTRSGKAVAFVSAGDPAEDGAARIAQASSEGPTYALDPKPALAAPATAIAPVTGGGSAFAAGTSIGAARVAAAAARLRRVRPRWSPAQLAAALVGTAEPIDDEGIAAVPDESRAAAAPLLPVPHVLAFPRRPPGQPWTATRRLVLENPTNAQVDVEASVSGDAFEGDPDPRRLRLPPRARRGMTVRLRSPRSRAAGFAVGVLSLATRGGATVRVPLGVSVAPPPPAPLGPLTLVRERDRVRGVRFSAGFVRRRGDARSVLPLGRLRLTLVGTDVDVVRELTPPGGAADLLPAEYAYTLTGETLRELPRGTYRFVARARGPGRGAGRSLRRSAPFELG